MAYSTCDRSCVKQDLCLVKPCWLGHMMLLSHICFTMACFTRRSKIFITWDVSDIGL